MKRKTVKCGRIQWTEREKEIQNELKQWIIRIYLIMKNQHSNKSTNIKKKIIKTAANNRNIEWFRWDNLQHLKLLTVESKLNMMQF